MDTRHLMTSRHSLLNWLLCGSRPCKDPLSLSGRLGYRLEARNDHGMILRGRVLGDQHHLNGPTVASRHVWQHETRDADECDKRQVGTCEKMKFSSVKKDVCGCVSFFKISLSLSIRLEAIATRVEAITSRLEAIASRLEAITIRLSLPLSPSPNRGDFQIW